LLGLAVVLALLATGQGGAKPAAAQPLTPHYECYDIVGSDPPDVVNLQTKFGAENDVAVGQATKLCLPAGKNSTQIPEVPHLKCYTIDGPPPAPWTSLTTQFGVQQHVELGRAKLLCVPAIKTVLLPSPEPPSGPLLTVPHYKCYEITSGANDPVDPVMLKTQFGTVSGVQVGPSRLLCLSAIKTKLPGGTPEGSLSVPPLECYTLPPAPPDPPRGVKLETQFGLEGAPPAAPIEVGPASMLCTPALSPVGGIAEGPGLAGASAEETGTAAESSGWSAAGYAALAGGLAAAVMVLSTGAWYARRRLLR
jgi:hypothetical protein